MLTNPTATFAIAILALASLAQAQSDFVVPANTTLVYDTANGPIAARNVRVESGATLRVVGGTQPFRVRADELLRIDGTIDLSGTHGESAVTFGTTNFPVVGGIGGPQGGLGGNGNPIFTTWSTRGGSGLDANGQPLSSSALGGESGLNANPGASLRRAAGGGGGAFGPDALLPFPPTDVRNVGRAAFDGWNGNASALGAESLALVPQGGSKSVRPFQDGDPTNDFFGRAVDPVTGAIVVGELAAPEAGRSGGGGGNGILGATFPPSTPWTYFGDERGGAGGGGGGLGILVARRIEFGSGGRVIALGGRGGFGENTTGFNHIGGGGGGGSGGMLVLQARVIDLSNASRGALVALGGRGGLGANHLFDVEGAGGNGGPGLIQLHVPQIAGSLLLPSGVQLTQLSAPAAKLLLPEPGL